MLEVHLQACKSKQIFNLIKKGLYCQSFQLKPLANMSNAQYYLVAACVNLCKYLAMKRNKKTHTQRNVQKGNENYK